MEGLFDRVGFASSRVGHALELSGIGWDIKLKSSRHLRFRCVRGVGRLSLRIPGQVLLKLPLGVPVPRARAFRNEAGWRAVDPQGVLVSPAITRQMQRAGVRRLDVRDGFLEVALDDTSDWREQVRRLQATMRLCDAIAWRRFGVAVFRLGLALGRHEAFGVLDGHPVRLRFARTGVDFFVHCRGRALAPELHPGLARALEVLGAHVAPDGLHQQTPPLDPDVLVRRTLALVEAAVALDATVGARRAS